MGRFIHQTKQIDNLIIIRSAQLQLNLKNLSMCKLEMASMLGRMQVEISNASMCTATSIVVHIANKNKRGFGSCSPSLLFNCISTTATFRI
jgi:hypothetical protein